VERHTCSKCEHYPVTVADIADTSPSRRSRNPPPVLWYDEYDICDAAGQCYLQECQTIEFLDL